MKDRDTATIVVIIAIFLFLWFWKKPLEKISATISYEGGPTLPANIIGGIGLDSEGGIVDLFPPQPTMEVIPFPLAANISDRDCDCHGPC